MTVRQFAIADCVLAVALVAVARVHEGWGAALLIAATLILAVAASAPAGATQIANTGTIVDDSTSGADANPADNSATATNPLDAHYDLVLANSPSVTSATPFSPVNYTLTYKAASAGKTLTVTWKMATGTGNVTINGAAF